MSPHPATAPRRRLALLVALLLGVAPACGDDAGDGAGPVRPERGGELVVATESEATTIAPGATMSAGETLVALAVFDPLTTYVHGEVVPFLAQSLEADDDLRTYEIELRAGVTFHDGGPLDAAAVVQHFERLKDPAGACPCLPEVALIESMEMPDGPTGLTVRFHLAEPSAALPALLAGSSGLIESPASGGLVGTGPFSLTERVPGQRIVLTAHPGYWGEDGDGVALPYLDRLVVVPIPDSTGRAAALTAGDIDLFQTTESGAILAAREAGFGVQTLLGSGTTSLLFNSSAAPFNDVRARQAVAYAVDRRVIDDRLYSGVRTPSSSPFAPDSPDRAADAPGYDPDRAAELVDDLGGLAFTITCTPTPEAMGIVQLVEQMGDRVGMDITVETQDQAAHDALLASRSGDYQAACLRTGPVVEPDALRATLTSGAPGNLTFYANLEVDQLLEAARGTADPRRRRRLYARVQEIVAEEVPSITTVYDLFANVYDRATVGPLPPGEANALGAIDPARLSARG